jgi:hypothetical protein
MHCIIPLALLKETNFRHSKFQSYHNLSFGKTLFVQSPTTHLQSPIPRQPRKNDLKSHLLQSDQTFQEQAEAPQRPEGKHTTNITTRAPLAISEAKTPTSVSCNLTADSPTNRSRIRAARTHPTVARPDRSPNCTESRREAANRRGDAGILRRGRGGGGGGERQEEDGVVMPQGQGAVVLFPPRWSVLCLPGFLSCGENRSDYCSATTAFLRCLARIFRFFNFSHFNRSPLHFCPTGIVQDSPFLFLAPF